MSLGLTKDNGREHNVSHSYTSNTMLGVLCSNSLVPRLPSFSSLAVRKHGKPGNEAKSISCNHLCKAVMECMLSPIMYGDIIGAIHSCHYLLCFIWQAALIIDGKVSLQYMCHEVGCSPHFHFSLLVLLWARGPRIASWSWLCPVDPSSAAGESWRLSLT